MSHLPHPNFALSSYLSAIPPPISATSASPAEDPLVTAIRLINGLKTTKTYHLERAGGSSAGDNDFQAITDGIEQQRVYTKTRTNQIAKSIHYINNYKMEILAANREKGQGLIKEMQDHVKAFLDYCKDTKEIIVGATRDLVMTYQIMDNALALNADGNVVFRGDPIMLAAASHECLPKLMTAVANGVKERRRITVEMDKTMSEISKTVNETKGEVKVEVEVENKVQIKVEEDVQAKAGENFKIKREKNMDENMEDDVKVKMEVKDE